MRRVCLPLFGLHASANPLGRASVGAFSVFAEPAHAPTRLPNDIVRCRQPGGACRAERVGKADAGSVAPGPPQPATTPLPREAN